MSQKWTFSFKRAATEVGMEGSDVLIVRKKTEEEEVCVDSFCVTGSHDGLEGGGGEDLCPMAEGPESKTGQAVCKGAGSLGGAGGVV